MGAMKMGRRVYVCGPLLAAMVVLLTPAVAAAADSPTVRVTRPAAGRIVLDVADDTVAVRKELTADRSAVTLTTARDRLSITVHRGVLTISGPRGAVTLGPGEGMESDRIVMLLQQSEAAARARTLLAAVSDGPNTLVGQSVLLTRALLEVGTGSVDAFNQHQRWVAERAAQIPALRRALPGPRVIRASYSAEPQSTPGYCWDTYAKEAIEIADEFADCTDDLSWYEVHKWAACTVIYTVRSEAAMAWFIACNGGVPFQG